ncbi:hypothetical protein IMG5_062470 [Ichthyophthirius multifiliis]|uniref:Uncharacterized protein n=1 Tax=Ichthyophthirius multifiliis TaxID=5932 RepID=G0QNY2_ICHMU|nr:hypothetical protein IMG5_062470 [Ichthyophthirius multifiliis]EGR33069.1 hypothetical protein IMG5_062470 [Ichthyophthirius multifiliis]|eukprot:XP_004037055.1 hypothetical protein IMG5_062470 [Ichthyophthirius multifiliis]
MVNPLIQKVFEKMALKITEKYADKYMQLLKRSGVDFNKFQIPKINFNFDNLLKYKYKIKNQQQTKQSQKPENIDNNDQEQQQPKKNISIFQFFIIQNKHKLQLIQRKIQNQYYGRHIYKNTSQIYRILSKI